jgi:hypothetical protein
MIQTRNMRYKFLIVSAKDRKKTDIAYLNKIKNKFRNSRFQYEP